MGKRLEMPAGRSLESLVFLVGGTLTLCAPLSPTQNEHQKYSSIRWWNKVYRRGALTILREQARSVLGVGREQPWAERARLSIVRCSCGTRAADTANVLGGAKELIDCLLVSTSRREGIALVLDDDPAHLTIGTIEDRPRGHWGDRPGPATWLMLERLS